MTKNNNTLSALFTGMLAGAAIVLLSDSNNRKRLKNKMVEAIDEGDKKLDDLQLKVNEAKNKTMQKASRLKSKAARETSKKLQKAQDKLATT